MVAATDSPLPLKVTTSHVITVHGSPFADDLTGSGLSITDTLEGAGGDDTLRGGGGADQLNGGAGTDVAVYDEAVRSAPIGGGLTAAGGTVTSPLDGAGDTLAEVERLSGTALGDTLSSSRAGSTLEGGGGDDSLTLLSGATDSALLGGGGGDTLTGADSADLLRGGGGADVLIGGGGLDVVSCDDQVTGVEVTVGAPLASGNANDGAAGARDTIQPDVETVTGTALDDRFTGDAGANTFRAGAGNDVLIGAGGNDTLDGGEGRDTASYEQRATGVIVALGAAAGSGGESDTLVAVEDLTGSSGDDSLTGDDGANRIDGAAGNDTITGLGGSDDLFGGPGADTLRADDGTADKVDCGDGIDTLKADAVDSILNCTDIVKPVDADGDGFGVDTDCNDGNAAIRPGALESSGMRSTRTAISSSRGSRSSRQASPTPTYPAARARR